MKNISSISLDEMEILFDQSIQKTKNFEHSDEIFQTTTTDAGGGGGGGGGGGA